jgi:hypothetical protein
MLDERKRRRFDAVVWSVALIFALVVPFAASADEKRSTIDHAAYRTECGSCHIAYPPALLGARAWHAIMNGLDRHFGTDASVDRAQQAGLTAYLEAAAGTRNVAGAARITESDWFHQEHREVAATTWKSAAVKSASNCDACHRRASAGDFSERTVQIPREGAR